MNDHIDINIFKIDHIDIDIFKNQIIDIDICQNVLIHVFQTAFIGNDTDIFLKPPY